MSNSNWSTFTPPPTTHISKNHLPPPPHIEIKSTICISQLYPFTPPPPNTTFITKSPCEHFFKSLAFSPLPPLSLNRLTSPRLQTLQTHYPHILPTPASRTASSNSLHSFTISEQWGNDGGEKGWGRRKERVDGRRGET
jgi:hypothetical protein